LLQRPSLCATRIFLRATRGGLCLHMTAEPSAEWCAWIKPRPMSCRRVWYVRHVLRPCDFVPSAAAKCGTSLCLYVMKLAIVYSLYRARYIWSRAHRTGNGKPERCLGRRPRRAVPLRGLESQLQGLLLGRRCRPCRMGRCQSGDGSTALTSLPCLYIVLQW